jgi:hypothetical protein
MIFSGIVACATDVSEFFFLMLYRADLIRKISPSDLEVLSAGITSLGGQWRTGLTRDVTHLFALHEQSDKVFALFPSFAPLMRPLLTLLPLTIVSNCHAFCTAYPHVRPHATLV